MRYGFYLPTRGPLANRHDLAAVIEAAERLGFASCMVADHIILLTEDPKPLSLHGEAQFRQRERALRAARR